jgi:hypothetical protein
MPNRWTRDANNALVPKVNIGSLPDGVVVNADIADDSITNVKINSSAGVAYSKLNLTGNVANADLAGSIEAGKIDFFKSTETTGTGSEADIAHGLGRTPALVIVVPTENTTGNTLDITEGAHDGTNVKVNAPSTCKYVVYAL